MQITREPSDLLFGTDYRFQLGRAVTVHEGSDVTLISTGVQTTRTYRAAEILAARGVGAAVLHVPTIKPLDGAAIVAAARASGFVITVEEQSVLGRPRRSGRRGAQRPFPGPGQEAGNPGPLRRERPERAASG
jgi:transketolase